MPDKTTRPDERRVAALAVVTARFAESTDGVIETIAAEHGLTPREVAGCLPGSTGIRVPGDLFQEIMHDVAEWGPVTVLVHTPDLILECSGNVPKGTVAQGYFNLIGDSPIGGHIRDRNCTDIHFVSRVFMGRTSHAILFFNRDGGVMFKIFVGRAQTLAVRAPGYLNLRGPFSTLIDSRVFSMKPIRLTGGQSPAPALPSAIARQRQQSLAQMLEEIPSACDRGAECNAQGYKVSWNG